MFKIFKSMKWFIKKNWFRYVLVIVFGLALTVLNLIPAYITGNLAEAIEKDIITSDFLIYQILIPYLFFAGLIYLTSAFLRFFQNRLTTELYYALQVKYMNNILIQDASFFEKFQYGDLLSRALGDVNQVKFSGGNRIPKIFVESLSVVVTFVAMCLINYKLAIACFLPLSFIFISNMVLRPIVKRNWKKVRDKHSELSNVVLESITNVRTIRAFSKEEENYNKLLDYSSEVYEVEKKNLKVNVIFNPLFQLIVEISKIVCYALGAYFYYKNEITIAELIRFIYYINLFRMPLVTIGNLINNFYQSLISVDRLNEIYDSSSKVINKNNPLELNEIDSLEFKDFSYKYEGDEFNALNNIDVRLEKGKTLGVVGYTASGKSSLIKQLLRQNPIEENKLYINDNPVEDYKKEDIRRKISYVPQEHVLFSRSVLDNVKLGNENASLEEINQAIRLADFEKDISQLPEGLDTIVGEYGVTLSGGQKQRLAIARAFLRNSDLMILDDSLSAVDGQTEVNIIKSIKEFRKNKTNIIIAHRLSAVVFADEIIVLNKGKIIERGTHDELMKQKGWYYEQYSFQKMTNKEAM